MAAGIKLVIQYETSNGNTTTHTWNYAKSTATAANVQTLVTTTIAKKTIFASQPTAVKSAKLVTTTETPYNLQEVMTANGMDLRELISTQPSDEEEEEEDEGEKIEETREIYNSKAAKIARLEAELAAMRNS